MDENRKVGFSEAVDVLRRLLEIQWQRTGRLPETVVTLGGTALSAHDIRKQTDDVDLYLSEVDDDVLALAQRDGKSRFGDRFKIDATPVNTIWGEIAISDIGQSPVVATIEVAGRKVIVRALDVETLYVVKVAADRPKDRIDQGLISRHTEYGKIVGRANRLFPSYGDREGLPAFAERLARCIARDFSMRLADVDADLALSETVRRKVSECRRALEASFMLALRSLMNRRPDLIGADPGRPDRLLFDAAAAGAPEELLGVMDFNRDEVSDIATGVLKAHDPKRHLAWLARRRTKPAEEQDPGSSPSFGR
ncbi:hypothetical protein [Methylobacterium fujisawaense]|uniref:hypothetical protein n=1 Tax=Methylobacterium fujisawaense TaxID=107400 RepID=UPI00313A8DC9